MLFVNAFENIKIILSKNKALVLLIIIGAFLRLYRLGQFATFLSDQGRDAIIIKRILALEHLPAIGAPSSLGQVYLGPFYYYFIAPFLAIFNYQPVGLAFGVALVSIAGMIASYFIVAKNANYRCALYFLILLTFSFVNIDMSRFSWNPNLLPLFSFLTLFFFYKTLTSQDYLVAFIFGAFLSFSIQLHYLAFFLLIPIVVVAIESLFEINKKEGIIRRFLTSAITFLIFSSPLFIFDLRHDFINSKNFVKMFIENKILSQASLTQKLAETTQAFLNHFLKLNLDFRLFIFIYLLLVVLAFGILLKAKKNLFLRIHLVNLIFFIFAFSFLNSSRHPHYYGVIYYSFFFILAYFMDSLPNKFYYCYLLIPLFFLTYIITNGKNYYFFSKQSSKQIDYSKKIANFLAEKIDSKPFNIATWPVDFTEDNFLYFLELKGLVPADRKKVEITDQMFVLCQKEPCQILNSPSWNISMFGKAKIAKIWKVEDLTIFKLVHGR